MIKKTVKFEFFLFLISGWLIVNTAQACDASSCSIRFNQTFIEKGYTIKAFADSLTIGIFPQVLKQETVVTVKNISNLNQESGLVQPINPPKGWVLNSDIYEYDILESKAYDKQKPLIVELAFGQDTDNYKKVFYFNQLKGEWQGLTTTINWSKHSARVKLFSPAAQLAIFDQVDVMGRGKASWYNQAKYRYFHYKNGDFAASQQYPKGTKLKVTNLNNDKTVIITVNDYGPEPWTKRILDLDVSAFKKLANKSIGEIKNISIEPVE